MKKLFFVAFLVVIYKVIDYYFTNTKADSIERSKVTNMTFRTGALNTPTKRAEFSKNRFNNRI